MPRSHVLTSEQINLLRTAYHGKPGQRIAFAQQLGVTEGTIGYWVRKLNLTTAGRRQRAIRRPEVLTDERRAYLLTHYTGGTAGAAREIAEALGVRLNSVRVWVRRLKLSKSRQEDLWTEADYAYLRTHLAHQSYADIALHLGRTFRSTICHAHLLGLRKRDAAYTLKDLSMALRCKEATIHRWMAAGWLCGTRSSGEQGLWQFPEKEVQRFLRQYPHAIADLRFDYLWVHDLLTTRRST